MRLELTYDEPLSEFAYNFNLHLYTKVPVGYGSNRKLRVEVRQGGH